MFRSLFPSILAILGLTMISWLFKMALFEWQISEIVTDFPSTYKVSMASSPVRTFLGNSLDDKSYVFGNIVDASEDGQLCSPGNFNSVVKRPQTDEMIEQISLLLNINQKNVSWLFGWGWIEIILSGIYIWWYTIVYEHHPISDAFSSTVVATIFAVMGLCLATIVLKWLGPIISYSGLGTLENCHGTFMFTARLSKIHYETLIVFFVSILAEVGALCIMLRQIIKAANKRKESSKSAVG